MHQSIFTIDMESTFDPLKPGYISSAIFKVSHPHKPIPIREINAIIRGINDEDIIISRQLQKIHYEIGVTSKWFIVAARSKVSRSLGAAHPGVAANIASTLARRGELLMEALHTHFYDCEILSLEETLMNCSNWCCTRRKRRRSRSDDLEEIGKRERSVERKGVMCRLLHALGYQNSSNREPSPKRKKSTAWSS